MTTLQSANSEAKTASPPAKAASADRESALHPFHATNGRSYGGGLGGDSQVNPAHPSAVHPLAPLHRAFGNQAVLRSLSRAQPAIQTKLAINQPGDRYEQEADRVAEQVMRISGPGATPAAPTVAPAGSGVQRKCACAGTCSKCQTERPDHEHEHLQMKPVGSSGLGQTAAPPIVHEVLRSSGQPLDAVTRAFMEPRFGHDFSRVRIHSDEQAAQSAQAVQARAYTVGSDIVFGSGQFAPNAQAGQRLLAHELAHAVQQDRGASSASPSEGGVLEQAATESAATASSTGSAPIRVGGASVPGRTRQPLSTSALTKIHHPAESDLTKGGERLPRDVAEFYETRFGRDLSAVRVHTGETAMRYNDAVNAYAFTYGNHIWLGPGLRPEPSHTLAHELAHVVQQTQPPRLASAPDEPDLSPSRQGVQRFAPYWMPERWNEVGTPTHAYILPAIGKKHGIFTEVPVPNAAKSGAAPGYEKKGGIADLYQASTIVDLYFKDHKIPKKLSSNGQLFSKLLYKGDRSRAIPLPAPQADEKNFNVIRAAKAPKNIRIGDLKPSHGTIEADEGPEQVHGYLKGFEIARDGVNEMEVGTGSFHQTDAPWPNLTTETFSGEVPEMFKEPIAKAQLAQPLKLIHNGRPVELPRRVMGKVYVRTNKDGIWTYTWAPTTRLTTEDLPENVTGLGADITAKIIRPLLVSPVQAAKKARPALRSASLTPSAQRIQAQERDEPAKDVKDSFDQARLQVWENDHRQLAGQEEKLEKTPAFKEAEFKSLIVQERQEAIKSHFDFQAISPGEKEVVKDVKEVQFWTKPSTRIFGKFRYYFGELFVKILNTYHRIRGGFQKLLHGKSAPKSGGLTGTIIKIVFQVLKIAASFMVDRTAKYLVDSLKTGVGQKLTSLVEEGIEGVESKIKYIEGLASDLEGRVKDTIDALVESTIGPYQGYIDTISKYAEELREAAEIISKVRWGARLLACLSPPGWGCLWILAQPIMEKFASWLVDRCWFQKAIAPLITGRDFIVGLPAKLAEFIINGIQNFLPEDFRGVFASIDASKVKSKIDPNEVCGEDDLFRRNPFEVEKEALAELRKDIGEEKWRAFRRLGELYGTKLGDPLTEQQIEQLKKELKRANLHALQEAADLYGAFEPSNAVTNLTEFLEEAERKKEEIYGGGEGGQGGGESGISVSPSEKAPAAEYKPTKLGFQVVSGVTRGQYKGAIIKVARQALIKGTVVTLADVEVVVGKRVFVPNQSNPEKVVVPLEVTRNQYFDIEKKYGAEVVKKIGYKSFEYKKGVKFSYTLKLKAGKAE